MAAEKPEDLSLPMAVISRIISDALPANILISAEAKRVIAKSASVFVLYTTAQSSTFTNKSGRKTMNVNDVMDAIVDMEFPHFTDTLEKMLTKFRETQQTKKQSMAARKLTGDKEKASKTPSAKSSPKAKKSKSISPKSKGESKNSSEAVDDQEVINLSGDDS